MRSAAWSVPVVAVAATAPAFAASTDAGLGWTDDPVKWGGQGDPKHVSWDLVLTNGSRTITSLVITLTYIKTNSQPYQGVTLDIYDFAPTVSPTPWGAPVVSSNGGSVVVTRTGVIQPFTLINIHTDFSGSDNSIGTVQASVIVNYTTGSPQTVTAGPVQFNQAPGGGNSEPLPHSQH